MIAPLLCFALAAMQFIASRVTDLSPWRGGGYGMYTEPHPVTCRTVWLSLLDDEKEIYYRIYPTDSRLHISSMNLTPHEMDLLNKFKYFGMKMCVFPNRYHEQNLICKSLKVVPILTSNKVFSLENKLTSKNVSVEVFEIRLKDKYWQINEL